MCSELLKVTLAQWGGEKPYLRITISDFFLTFVEAHPSPSTDLCLSEHGQLSATQTLLSVLRAFIKEALFGVFTLGKGRLGFLHLNLQNARSARSTLKVANTDC